MSESDTHTSKAVPQLESEPETSSEVASVPKSSHKKLIIVLIVVVVVIGLGVFALFKSGLVGGSIDLLQDEEVTDNPFDQDTNPFDKEATNPFAEKDEFTNPFAEKEEDQEYSNPFGN